MVSVENLANEIAKELGIYTREIEEKVEKEQVEVAKDAVSKLRSLNNPKLTGKYRKGWRVKKVGKDVFIHNATHYQLTHLLENGHAKVGGGRVSGIPHIRPIEEDAVNTFINKIERAISR
nr:HK97 gp10 family phage protein [Bacillus cereus group sp. BfR-BA-01380]